MCSLVTNKPLKQHALCAVESGFAHIIVEPLIYLIVNMLVTQSCLTLCDPMDYSLPGSSVHRILQARILEWVAIPFSRGSSWPRGRTQVSHIAGGFLSEPPGNSVPDCAMTQICLSKGQKIKHLTGCPDRSMLYFLLPSAKCLET